MFHGVEVYPFSLRLFKVLCLWVRLLLARHSARVRLSPPRLRVQRWRRLRVRWIIPILAPPAAPWLGCARQRIVQRGGVYARRGWAVGLVMSRPRRSQSSVVGRLVVSESDQHVAAGTTFPRRWRPRNFADWRTAGLPAGARAAAVAAIYICHDCVLLVGGQDQFVGSGSAANLRAMPLLLFRRSGYVP
jgi:hypothetical protein